MFTTWQYGVEKVYLNILTGTTNAVLSIIKDDTNIDIEETGISKTPYQFKVTTVIEGRVGSYPQEIGGLLQPTVIILTWQIFLFFVLKMRSAGRLTLINLSIFLIFQIFFLVLLTGYYTSDTQQFLYNVMLDSFYVIAVILIIKDNIFNPVFSTAGNQPKYSNS